MVLQHEKTNTAKRTHFVRSETIRNAWPDAVTLREILQNPRTSLTAERDLCLATVEFGRNGLPLAFTGRFAVVFRLTLAGNTRVALRIFTASDSAFRWDREQRSRQIGMALEQLQAQVGDLLPPPLYVSQAVRFGEEWFPAQLMPWAEGEPLLDFVSKNRTNPLVLRTLAQTVAQTIDRLESVGVAHGDLQHDNVLVANDGQRITLVDYDALYTPDLDGFAPPGERGHPNYQHPQRRTTDFGVGIDRFAGAVIRTGLLLLAVNPAAWDQFDGENGEGVLFTAKDFEDEKNAFVFDVAKEFASQDSLLEAALSELKMYCALPGPVVRTIRRAQTVRLDPAPATAKRYPSRVSPTCEDEIARPVSYLAPLRTTEFARQEAAHVLVVRGYLLIAPPVAFFVWLMAWDEGGPKWPFLAYLFVLLVVLQVVSLYLAWGVKRQSDALELEMGKLREAEETSQRLRAQLTLQLDHLKARGGRELKEWEIRAHLRQTLAHIPLSRAISEAAVPAWLVRDLRAKGIETAGQLWQRHGFLPFGMDAMQAAALRAWMEQLEYRERERFARESNPERAIEARLTRLKERTDVRRARLQELKKERELFPNTSFLAFLRRRIASPVLQPQQ